MRTLLVLFAAVLTLPFLPPVPVFAADSPQTRAPAPTRARVPRQSAQGLDRLCKVRLKYLLYLPQDYETKEAWPLVLFLHGSGERGDNLELVKKHGPPKLVAEGKEFPFVLVSPQCPAFQDWQPVELSALLDEIVEKQKIDNDRIYVTGLSMGGYGAWSLAIYSPKRFAAIAPMCGGGEPEAAKLLSGLPAWVFHGARDRTVSLAGAADMVSALKKAGDAVKFTIDPDAAHDCWTKAYDDPKLYQWLLQHKRTEDKKE